MVPNALKALALAIWLKIAFSPVKKSVRIPGVLRCEPVALSIYAPAPNWYKHFTQTLPIGAARRWLWLFLPLQSLTRKDAGNRVAITRDARYLPGMNAEVSRAI